MKFFYTISVVFPVRVVLFFRLDRRTFEEIFIGFNLLVIPNLNSFSLIRILYISIQLFWFRSSLYSESFRDSALSFVRRFFVEFFCMSFGRRVKIYPKYPSSVVFPPRKLIAEPRVDLFS